MVFQHTVLTGTCPLESSETSRAPTPHRRHPGSDEISTLRRSQKKIRSNFELQLLTSRQDASYSPLHSSAE